ncbi:CPBP family intramembrane metalloprotease [Erwinia sp. CPCC 100877]|nr:CPBP family intramembrane metalloprotease [Erwinia sp. CPCC 100877]
MKKALPLWKVLVICIASIAILLAAQIVASFWLLLDLYGVEQVLTGATYVGLAYVLLKLLMEKWTGISLPDLMIDRFHLKPGWGLIALMLPLAVIGCFVLLMDGTFSVNHFSTADTVRTIISAVFLTGIATGIVEEMIFRGVIMNVIERKSNKLVAIILPSFLFSSVHLLNGALNMQSTLLLLLGGTLAGMMFSLMAYCYQSIWASAVLHAVWNIFMIGGILSIRVKQSTFSLASYVLRSRSLLLTGGEFGVEVSLFAMIGYVLVIVYLIYLYKKKQRKKN